MLRPFKRFEKVRSKDANLANVGQAVLPARLSPQRTPTRARVCTPDQHAPANCPSACSPARCLSLTPFPPAGLRFADVQCSRAVCGHGDDAAIVSILHRVVTSSGCALPLDPPRAPPLLAHVPVCTAPPLPARAVASAARLARISLRARRACARPRATSLPPACCCPTCVAPTLLAVADFVLA